MGTEERCGKWMPRAQDYYARTRDHKAECRTAKALEEHRARKTARRIGQQIDPAAQTRWRRTSRLRGYGLTEEAFAILMEVQGNACGVCHETFAKGQAVFIDHDHRCCGGSKGSCGSCVRGLLGLRCNVGLGYIERMTELVQPYLNTPPAIAARARSSAA